MIIKYFFELETKWRMINVNNFLQTIFERQFLKLTIIMNIQGCNEKERRKKLAINFCCKT